MKTVFCFVLSVICCAGAWAQKDTWRRATDAELGSLLPARAPVEKEHIETEMRTASGIVDKRGHFIAGVILITAGYSAEGKYSHYLVVQAPIKIGGVSLKPGEYVFGYTHQADCAHRALQRGINRSAGRHHRGAPVAPAHGGRKPAHLASGRKTAVPDRPLRHSVRDRQ